MQSKIAAREASRGFGVEREAARIMSFAAEEEEDEDMLACPPVGKHGQVRWFQACRRAVLYA
eukprot:scaffold85477_cov14-Tisochrysis_lutea.AAC.1